MLAAWLAVVVTLTAALTRLTIIKDKASFSLCCDWEAAEIRTAPTAQLAAVDGYYSCTYSHQITEF